MAINANSGRFFPVQAVHFGVVTDPRKFSQSVLPTDLLQVAGGAGFGIGGQLGTVLEWQGGVFRLVQVDTSAVATIDGGVVYWLDKANFKVTADADQASEEGAADGIAGGTHVVVASDALVHYIFIQIGGYQAAVVVAGSTVNGDHMTGHASTDNVLTRTAAGTAAVDKQAATALSTRGSTNSDNGAAVANSSKVSWILGNLL